jgi:NAD(P)-dependent dehydrogenase (short-subunit alcohol dehydrogenase family)
MNQQRDLEGISALVTGASSGIGRHGAEVVVHGRDAARGSAVADTITAEGGKSRFFAADLTGGPAGTAQDPCRRPFRLSLYVVRPGPLRAPAAGAYS